MKKKNITLVFVTIVFAIIVGVIIGKSLLKYKEGEPDVVGMHMAHPNGRICGAKRPKCEAERSLHL